MRLYPNATQRKWLDTNLINCLNFHNYLLENIYENDIEIDVETGEEKEVSRINWDVLSNNLGLLQHRFYSQHSDTVTDIYNQVSRNLRQAFSNMYNGLAARPKFHSIKGKLSFRIPVRGRSFELIRQIAEMNHGNREDSYFTKIMDVKSDSKLSHNIGWLYVSGCGKANPKSGDFIKCFCPMIRHLDNDFAMSITFTRTPDMKYYASITLREGKIFLNRTEPIDAFNTPVHVGIDLNLSPKRRVVTRDYAITETTNLNNFDGNSEVIQAPTPYKDYQKKLAKEQRKLSRKRGKPRSKRWWKQKTKLAKIHAKIANIRQTFNRQTANYLTRNYHEIAMEDLSVTQMKHGQPRFIQKMYNDANLYQLRQAIHWSCIKHGRWLWFVSPEHTSKTCSSCFHTNHELKWGQSNWMCPRCGKKHQRDINAAKNIYNLAFDRDCIEGELLNNVVQLADFSARNPVPMKYDNGETIIVVKQLSKILKEEVVDYQTWLATQ